MEFVEKDGQFEIYRGEGAIVAPAIMSLILRGFIFYIIIDSKEINGVFWFLVCLFLLGVWGTYWAFNNRNEPVIILNDKGIKSFEGFHKLNGKKLKM